MKEPRTEFGRELRQLRTKGTTRYSLAELAELAGVTASYISQLETGEKSPTPRVIRKLSRHLGVAPNHLLSKIGMVEMDLAGTLASNREHLNSIMPDMTDEQLEELANYLTYLDFKVTALK